MTIYWEIQRLLDFFEIDETKLNKLPYEHLDDKLFFEIQIMFNKNKSAVNFKKYTPVKKKSILEGLVFFGLIKRFQMKRALEYNYDEIEIEAITKYNSFNEFKMQASTGETIFNNFVKDKEFFRKRIISSLYTFQLNQAMIMSELKQENKNGFWFDHEAIKKFNRKNYWTGALQSHLVNFLDAMFHFIRNNLFYEDPIF